MTEPPKHETDEDIIDWIEQQQHDAQDAADNEYSKYLAEDEIERSGKIAGAPRLSPDVCGR